MPKPRSRHAMCAAIASVGGFLAISNAAQAQQITWIGGSGTWTNAANPEFWNPADEPDDDEDAVFNTPHIVVLGNNNSVASLTLSGGMLLDSAGADITVANQVRLTGPGTRLAVSGATSLLRADAIRLDGVSSIELNGGVITMDMLVGHGLFDINAGATLRGIGTINLTDTPTVGTTVIVNDGTITAGIIPITDPPPAATLLINGVVVHARIDLDGTTGTGVVNILRNQTLDTNLTPSDEYSGTMNLYHDSTFRMVAPWIIDTGTVYARTGAAGLTPAGVAHVAGGTLTMAGGTISVLDTDGAIHFDAPLVMNGGTVQTNGRVVLNAYGRIGATAVLAGTGSLVVSSSGSLTIDHTATVGIRVRNEGTLSIAGDSAAGQATVRHFEQAESGRLKMQLGGSGSTLFDRLTVSGNAVLDGELRISLVNAFKPLPGHTYDVMTYLSRTGEFDLINQTGIPGLTLTQSYGANALVLTAGWALPGDADMNLRVDVLDLVALASNWLGRASWLGGDFDGNGMVDQHDLGLMAMHWNTTLPAGSFVEMAASLGLPAETVPEPVMAWLVPMVACILPRRRHR